MANIPEDRKLEMLYEKDFELLTDEEIEKLIPFELKKWEKLNLDPSKNVTPDMFAIQNQLMTIIQILQEKNVITGVEIDSIFRKKTLSTLMTIRNAIQGEIIKARLTAGIHLQTPDEIGNGGVELG